MSTSKHLLPAFVAVLAADLTGLAVAIATNLDGLGHALVSGTPINAPLPFVTVQALVVVAAARATGRVARVAAGALAVLCAISVTSGFGDGSYGYDGLTAAQVTI